MQRRHSRRHSAPGASKLAAVLLLLSLVAAEASKLNVTVTLDPPGTAAARFAAAKQAAVGKVVSPVAAGSLDVVEDVAGIAASATASARRELDKKLASAGLPTTAALAARAKNATVVPARAKGAAAVAALRNKTDSAVDGAWDGALRLESQVARDVQSKRFRAGVAGILPLELTTRGNSSVYEPPRDKAREALLAGKAASDQALKTKRDIEDAAFSSDKGKERFSVLVSLNVAYDPKSDNGVEGGSPPRDYPLPSEILEASASAAAGAKAAVAAKIANVSAAVTSAVAGGGGVSPSSSSSSASAASATATAAVPAVSSFADVTAATHPRKPGRRPAPLSRSIKPAPGKTGNAAKVAFSADVVAGREGNVYFDESVVHPDAVANAVRAMLVSKLRRLASDGNADASALLSLGDGSSGGRRTAAPLLSARGLGLDAGQGVYLVGISFPALLPGAPLPVPGTSLRSQLMTAVNDADPSDPCGSLRERTGFDVCDAIDDSTHLTVSSARLLAVKTTQGAADAFAGNELFLLPLGRRSRSGASERAGVRAPAKSGLVASAAKGSDPAKTAEYAKKIFDSGTKVAAILGQPELAGFFKTAGAASGYIASGYTTISKIFGFGRKKKLVPEPNPNVVYFEEIAAISNKILDELDDISDEILVIDEELQTISSQLKQIQDALVDQNCNTAIDQALADLKVIQARWTEYDDPSPGGVRTSVELAMNAISNGTSPLVDPDSIYEPWVKNVLAEPGNSDARGSVASALDALHTTLVQPDLSSTRPDIATITICAKAAMNTFLSRTESSVLFSFDDRQYFTQIENLLNFFQIWQARALQMIQEAYIFRAQEAALNAWAANLASVGVLGCNTDSELVDRSLCVLDAEQLPLAGPQFCSRLQSVQNKLPPNFKVGTTAPLFYCGQLDALTQKITNNVYAQQDVSGVPYSWGQEGEGVRLVLGSDMTNRPSIVEGKPTQTKTEWLVPASPGAFFSECADPSNSGPCPLLGFHGDSSFGFSTAQQGYPGGYAADLWQPAGADVWVNGLRGMQPFDAKSPNATVDTASLLSIMEKGFEAIGAVAFTNIRDRLWWIAGATTGARLANFGLEGSVATEKNVVPVYDKTRGGPRVGNASIPSDGRQPPGNLYFLPKELAMKTAYCFAGAGATDTTNGASGVVCTSEDFTGVFEGKCTATTTTRPSTIDIVTGFDPYATSGNGYTTQPATFYTAPVFDFYNVTNDMRVLNYTTRCELALRDWVASSPLGVGSSPLGATQPLRVFCPMQRTPVFSSATGDVPECGLANLFAYPNGTTFDIENMPFGQLSQNFLNIDKNDTCPTGQGAISPMDTCIRNGDRLSYPFWDPNSFDGGGNVPSAQKVPPPVRLHRLPAVRLSDVEPKNASASCRAQWNSSIPVRCGVDKTRFLVAKLGARGLADTDSWPARDGLGAPATTAVAELFDDGGEIKVKCSPRWLRKDRSPPQNAALTPTVTSKVISQSAGPVFASESKLAFSNSAAELVDDDGSSVSSVSFTNAFPADKLSATAYNRYLPRIIACEITAEDPANNGLPVYALGAYVATADPLSPFGIKLVPFTNPL